MRIQVIDTSNLKLKFWNVIRFPLSFFLFSVVFFIAAFFFLPGVFQIFLYINTVIHLVNMTYAILFGLIPAIYKEKNLENYAGSELVSILIPVFNDGDILEHNLQNLLKLNYPNYEIIVIYSSKVRIAPKK